MDDILSALAFYFVIGAQFLAVVAARHAEEQMPRSHQAPDGARLRHIWLFG